MKRHDNDKPNHYDDCSERDRRAADKVFAEIKSDKDYLPKKASADANFFVNIDTANEQVHRLSGAKRPFIANLDVANAVIELLRRDAPAPVATIVPRVIETKPKPAVVATVVAQRPTVELTGIQRSIACALGKPATRETVDESGPRGLQRAILANQKLQAKNKKD